jgi:hypothetical protein
MLSLIMNGLYSLQQKWFYNIFISTKQFTVVHYWRGLALLSFSYGESTMGKDLHGSDHKSVILYVHRDNFYIDVCVLFKPWVKSV